MCTIYTFANWSLCYLDVSIFENVRFISIHCTVLNAHYTYLICQTRRNRSQRFWRLSIVRQGIVYGDHLKSGSCDLKAIQYSKYLWLSSLYILVRISNNAYDFINAVRFLVYLEIKYFIDYIKVMSRSTDAICAFENIPLASVVAGVSRFIVKNKTSIVIVLWLISGS